MDWYRHTRASFAVQPRWRRFGGWVLWASAQEVELFCADSKAITTGEKISGEIHGVQRMGKFTGTISDVSGDRVKVRLAAAIRETFPKEDARVLIENLFGFVEFRDHVANFEVIDMNSRGVGILLDEPLTVGAEHLLELIGTSDILRGYAVVRHCSELPGGKFKAGVHMHHFNRIDQAKWRQVMDFYVRDKRSYVNLVKAS